MWAELGPAQKNKKIESVDIKILHVLENYYYYYYYYYFSQFIHLYQDHE
jgi:hypothetical protein